MKYDRFSPKCIDHQERSQTLCYFVCNGGGYSTNGRTDVLRKHRGEELMDRAHTYDRLIKTVRLPSHLKPRQTELVNE